MNPVFGERPEHGAGINRAIENGWLVMHENGLICGLHRSAGPLRLIGTIADGQDYRAPVIATAGGGTERSPSQAIHEPIRP
jgi:hypothetical protein